MVSSAIDTKALDSPFQDRRKGSISRLRAGMTEGPSCGRSAVLGEVKCGV